MGQFWIDGLPDPRPNDASFPDLRPNDASIHGAWWRDCSRFIATYDRNAAKRCFISWPNDASSHRAQRVGEPKPAGLERCDESRRARLCWTRALVEYRNRRAVQGGHSRHGNQAVAEVERVSWQDGCYETGEQTGDAGGRNRRSTWHVAKGGAVGTGDEMRSGGVRLSEENQTCGQEARSSPTMSAILGMRPERWRCIARIAAHACQRTRTTDSLSRYQRINAWGGRCPARRNPREDRVDDERYKMVPETSSIGTGTPPLLLPTSGINRR